MLLVGLRHFLLDLHRHRAAGMDGRRPRSEMTPVERYWIDRRRPVVPPTWIPPWCFARDDGDLGPDVDIGVVLSTPMIRGEEMILILFWVMKALTAARK